MRKSASRDSALWRFSLAVYERDGVEAECLDVQERFGVDVNLLMFCAYIGSVEGAVLTGADVAEAAAAVGAWQSEVVGELRQLRRTLKPWGSVGSSDFWRAAELLRHQIKAAELEAEWIEQAILWSWARSRVAAWRRLGHREALAANLRALLVRCGAQPAQAEPADVLAHLIDASLLIASRPRTPIGKKNP